MLARFVDRDIFLRHVGGGVGHLGPGVVETPPASRESEVMGMATEPVDSAEDDDHPMANCDADHNDGGESDQEGIDDSSGEEGQETDENEEEDEETDEEMEQVAGYSDSDGGYATP